MLTRRRSWAETQAGNAEPPEPATVPEARPGDAPRSYHHGNLREALIDAALELVRERGPDAFTLREVARRAGVSHAAPYRHFSDRAALLAAAAERTYTALADTLALAARDAPTPAAALREACLSYVGFALQHPTGFRLLFQPEARAGAAAGRAGGGDVFECLASAVLRAQQAGELRGGEHRELALSALSMMHGLSCLSVDGGLPDGAGATPLELATRLFDVLAAGLRP